MNGYRKAVIAIRCVVALITAPIWIPLLAIVLPFTIYNWLKEKAERIEDNERHAFLHEEWRKNNK